MADDNVIEFPGTWVDEVPELNRRTKWSVVVDMLKENPGKWRMFEVPNATSIAQHIRRTYEGVETTTRDDEELYLRWPK